MEQHPTKLWTHPHYTTYTKGTRKGGLGRVGTTKKSKEKYRQRKQLYSRGTNSGAKYITPGGLRLLVGSCLALKAKPTTHQRKRTYVAHARTRAGQPTCNGKYLAAGVSRSSIKAPSSPPPPSPLGSIFSSYPTALHVESKLKVELKTKACPFSFPSRCRHRRRLSRRRCRCRPPSLGQYHFFFTFVTTRRMMTSPAAEPCKGS